MFGKRCPTGATSAGLEVEVVTTAGRARAVLCCAAALVTVGAWATGVAGAAITAISSFDLSPTSGPPGTTVNFAGTACSPGLTREAESDYAEITAPAFHVSMRAPVADNGSWHGSFKVPANAPTGLPSLVLAVCYSDGWPSFTTIYSAQTFTVTAPPSTTTPTTTSTTPTTPTTKPGGSGGTTPPTNGDPGPGGGNEPGSTAPAFGGFPPDSSGDNTRGGAATKPPGTKKADVSRATHRAARAADLSVPGLPAAQVSGTGGLGWLAWLLVLVLVVSAVGAPFWLRRSRRSQADPIGDGG
jgi:hypothetical protein